MSRPPAPASGPSYSSSSSHTLAHLQSLLGIENESTTDRSPKDWFERALRESELAILAERKQRKEDMFLCYTKACHYYVNTKMHPDFAFVRKGDPNWGTRVKDFRETYEAYLVKAKELKEVLKKRDIERDSTHSSSSSGSVPAPTPKNSGPEVSSLGSIADRMKALSGKGMDVGNPNKRMSKDMAPPPPPVSSGLARNGHVQATGGAGNYGPARTTTTRPRTSSQTSVPESGQRSRSSSVKESKPPSNTPTTPAFAHESHNQSTSTPRHVPPAVAPKPKLPTPPDHHQPPSAVRQSNTGSSSTSTSANAGDTTPSSAVHSRTPLSAKPPLPPIPSSSSSTQQPQLTGPRSGVPKSSGGGLDDFERTFPSLDDFGKRFDPEPERANGNGNGNGRTGIEEKDEEDDNPSYAFPDVPSFPDLPSAPTSRPGRLPSPPAGSPPARFEGLRPVGGTTAGHDSPPNPDVDRDTKRPSSQPNLTQLDGRIGTSSAELENLDTPAPPPGTRPVISPLLTPTVLSPQSTTSPPNGHTPPSQPLSFPTPRPAPAQRQPQPVPKHSQETRSTTKPKFPFSNSINPETLRSYFLNPEIEMVLLDVRPEDENKRGYVGAEYESRGAKVRTVWMDPTVLLRNDITSTKLEDSLSLSPESQRKAFEDRHKFDLVVVYDSRSDSWPRKGAAPSPLSRLWDAIYEHEFSKKLERTPVLLEGGYAAWREFIKMRVAKNVAANASANGHGHGNGPRTSSKQINGNASPMSPPRQPERNGSGESSKRSNRDMPVYQASPYSRNVTDTIGHHAYAQSMGTSSQIPSRSYVTSPPSSHHRPSHSTSSNYNSPSIAPPPQASIHPGPGVRRQSDYVEHHNQSYSGYVPASSSARQPIDYPTPHGLSHPQLPPMAASHVLERQDQRPAVPRSTSIRGLDLVANGEAVRYWGDVMLGLTGLKNFGSTCYMNSTIQCLSATYPFSQYFLDGSFKRAINYNNKLGTQGNLANAWSELLKALWREDYTFLSPVTFRTSIVRFASQFSATNEQHDSQEFLSFVLDGLHEDLNRVQKPPPPVEMTPEREAALETLPPEVAAEKEWQIYKQRNDSFIVDLFQGQYRNRLECLTCHKTSTTYDTFMYISLPITGGKNKMVIQELIDDFIASEIMDGDDKWNCPRCKVPRRAAKTLTIARLPPIVIIQLKRFTTKNGVFWDKSENHVIFPIRGLDLTRYVPYRQQRGTEDMDDPRTQIGPFKYDLFGVSNHIGTLSSGHYTAFVKSAKGWTFAEDSRISRAHEKDIVSRQAYMLFYKRVR